MKIEIKKLENSEIEIIGAIPYETLQKHRQQVIKKLSRNMSVDGFRKGHIPENILVNKLGEMTILHEMGELALQSSYPKIVAENKLDVIGTPQVTITKLAPNNPMEFKITTSVMPIIKLPDYKKIAKTKMLEKEKPVEVTEEELNKSIEQIRKARKQTKKEGEEVNEKDLKEKLPELNEEFVKTLGDFKNVEDFKNKLKETLKHEKEHRAKEAKRLKILETILKEVKIELPKLLVEAELRKMLAEMSDNISKMGLRFDEYLKQIKKTEEDLKKEWHSDAKNRVKGQLVLNKISAEEKITPDEKEVKKTVDALMSQYKDAKRENVEVYVKMMLSNEEVFKFFENQK